jgi:hypothetical protein
MNKIVDIRKPAKKKDNLPLYLEAALDILGVSGITVYMVDMPELSTQNYIFLGITEKLEMPDTYKLYLQPTATLPTKKTTICHEAIHIRQYHSGRLLVKDKKTLIFDGKEYKPPYDRNQPHEREAFKGQNKLKRQVNEKIKKLQHR